MKWIDLPPFWLFGCLALTWASPWIVPWGRAFWPGIILIIAAMWLTVAALAEFRRAKTTFVPRQQPVALITTGVFRLSRNPIYLADVLVLLGFSLLWGKLLGFLLVPPFALMLQRRFILGEEARLRAEFGPEFDDYACRTRRWL